MKATLRGMCPQCRTHIEVGEDITRRPVDTVGGKVRWAHVDCLAAAVAREVAEDEASAKAYADWTTMLAAIEARQAAWEAGLRTLFDEEGADAIANAEQEMAYAVSVLATCTMDIMSEQAEWRGKVQQAQAKVDFLRALAA